MTYLSAEQSVQDSEPRELVTISINDVETYWHTSATRDITYDGHTFTAIAMERGALMVSKADDSNDVDLTLPIDHPFCRRWTRQAVPPRKVTVAIRRQNGGETETIWIGDIESMSAEDRVAKFNVPPRAGRWMLRVIPSLLVGTTCPHMLYDSACRVSRTGSTGGLAHKVTTTVIAISGRDITVDLGDTDRNGTWAANGEVVHTLTNERMTVGTQADANPGVSAVAVLTMQAQIVGMQIGDSVDIYAGCDWSISTCDQRFDNRQNFGGFPNKSSENPFTRGIRGA